MRSRSLLATGSHGPFWARLGVIVFEEFLTFACECVSCCFQGWSLWINYIHSAARAARAATDCLTCMFGPV